MSCVPVAGAVCAATRSMANTAPSKPINKQTANIFIQSSLCLDQCHAVGTIQVTLSLISICVIWGLGWPKSCVRRESSPHSRTVISRARRHSHFVPEADICSAAKSVLFDELVGTGEKHGRHFEAESFGGFQIYDQLELRGCLHRQVHWLFAFQDAVDIFSRAGKGFTQVYAIGHEAAVPHHKAK